MVCYSYSGLDQQGKKIRGEIFSENMKQAQSVLLDLGILIKFIKIKKIIFLKLFFKNLFKKLVKYKNKIKILEIHDFLKSLSWLLSSGLSLGKALNLLESQKLVSSKKSNKNKKIKENKVGLLIQDLKNQIESGLSLADALAHYKNYFSPEVIEWIRAGESSGSLGSVLLKIIQWQEAQYLRIKKIKKALAYPVLMMGVMLAVLILMMVLVIPEFEKMFASFNAKLPGLTQGVINFSRGFLDYFLIFIIFIFLNILVFYECFKNKKFKYFEKLNLWKDKILISLPYGGFLIKKSMDSKIFSLLGISLSSGVVLTKALKSAQQVTGNLQLKAYLMQAEARLWEGWSLSQAFGESGYFFKADLTLLEISESTGQLDQILLKLGEQAADVFDEKTERFLLLLEPILMIFMGGLVGFFVLAMYLPIFQLGAVV